MTSRTIFIITLMVTSSRCFLIKPQHRALPLTGFEQNLRLVRGDGEEAYVIEETLQNPSVGEQFYLDDLPVTVIRMKAGQRRRRRRQVIRSDPVEQISCSFEQKVCSYQNGTCEKLGSKGLKACKARSGELQLYTRECSPSSAGGCRFEHCERRTYTGSCISLRGGTQACRDENAPYLILEHPDCLL